MGWLLGFAQILSSLTPAHAPSAKIDDLAFFAGAWAVERNGTLTEEYWSPPKAGAMFGVGRTIKGDKTLFFEYFRVEQRGDDLFYIATPKGEDTTEFRLTSFDGKRAIFENPQHDYPTKVIYENVDANTLKASIEGVRNGKSSGMTWEYKRVN